MPQSDLSIFAQLAQHLSPPLIVVGLALVLIFGVHKALIGSALLERQSAEHSYLIVRLFLRYGFTLGVLATVLGFALALVQAVLTK